MNDNRIEKYTKQFGTRFSRKQKNKFKDEIAKEFSELGYEMKEIEGRKWLNKAKDYFFGNIKNNNRILLVIRGKREKTEEIRKIVFEYFDKAPQLKVNNSTEESIEFIYEISKKNMDKSQKLEDQKSKNEDRKAKHIIDRLYEIGNIDYVNIVLQSDEIA